MLLSQLLGEKIEQDVNVTGVAYDSRSVEKGNVFVCIKGFSTDGHQFAKMAEGKGAAAIIAEDAVDVSVPVIYVENARRTIAKISSAFFDHPSRKFSLIGVTGTNGKTTVTYLIKSILEAAGKRVGVIGTNQNIIGDKVLLTQSTTPTTPNALELQKLFCEMVEENAEYVVMEVSSHALALDRVYGCEFDVGVFTNITQDHLDFHKTMEDYLAAKVKLFDMCKKGVVNVDDAGGQHIIKKAPCNILTVGIEKTCDIQAKNISICARGSSFDAVMNGCAYPMELAIPGKFSVYNAVCAMGAAHACGISIQSCQKGLAAARGVMGRVEVVPTDTDYTVIIDYAHTPDGLENIISTIQEFAKGRVITLFGCGGDRDRTKRPVMGEIAGRLSDYVIVTSDNPRTEEPGAIIREIEEGVKQTGCEYTVIENRREAIGYALETAKKDDVIILAGKGQETYQIIGKEKVDFDERVIVHQCLSKK